MSGKKKMVVCFYCCGSKKDDDGNKCPVCDGTGETESVPKKECGDDLDCEPDDFEHGA